MLRKDGSYEMIMTGMRHWSASFQLVTRSPSTMFGRQLSFLPVMLGLFAVRAPAQDSTPGPPSTSAACANPPMDQCAFYANCLESRYHCGPDGYPIGYGQHYCQQFSDNRGLFDAQGQRWMLDTMHCLQLALVGDAVDADPTATTCQALKEEAFGSHAPCYTANGFCSLGIEGWSAVLEIVDIMTLFSSWEAFKATIQTAEDCVALYAYFVERGLVGEAAPSSRSVGGESWRLFDELR